MTVYRRPPVVCQVRIVQQDCIASFAVTVFDISGELNRDPWHLSTGRVVYGRFAGRNSPIHTETMKFFHRTTKLPSSAFFDLGILFFSIGQHPGAVGLRFQFSAIVLQQNAPQTVTACICADDCGLSDTIEC